MDLESYLEELVMQLQRRGLSEDRIGQVIDEIESLAITRALELFATAGGEQGAAQERAAPLVHRVAGTHFVSTVRVLKVFRTSGFTSACGAWHCRQ